MTAEPMRRATSVGPGPDEPVTETVTLDYEGRMLRRRRLTTDAGLDVMVDLPEVRSLDDGDCLILEDGGRISVVAAPEDCLSVTGDLPRLAWHIGNRHAPCRIEAARLLIRTDPVLARMIAGLGGTAIPVREPFRPEGGAFGHGRTMGHAHAETSTTHSHSHASGESHTHTHTTSYSHTHRHD